MTTALPSYTTSGDVTNPNRYDQQKAMNSMSLNWTAAPPDCSGWPVASTAERLLAITRVFSDPVDHVVFNSACGIADSLKSYQVIPALCVQTKNFYPEGSDLIEAPALVTHSDPRFSDNLVNRPWVERKGLQALRRVAHRWRRHWRTAILFADQSGAFDHKQATSVANH